MRPSRAWRRSTSPTSNSRWGPKASATSRRHSRANGACAMCGTGTSSPAISASFAASISLSPGGKSTAHTFMASAETLVNEVHDEDAGLGDVAGRVLRGCVELVLEPEHDQRRIFREDVEEAERRRVDDAVGRDARHERDRARHDRRAQELVALAWLKLGKGDREGHEPALACRRQLDPDLQRDAPVMLGPAVALEVEYSFLTKPRLVEVAIGDDEFVLLGFRLGDDLPVRVHDQASAE